MTIYRGSLRNSGLLLLFFEFNHFSFLIDIIDNIIYMSGSRHQNSNQWQCSSNVTCLRLYHVTSMLHCHWREFWSRDTDVYLTYIYTFWYNLTQFYVNFSRDRNIQKMSYICISLNSWDFQVSAYLSFYLNSPFNN